jgi:hypothetical protein
VKRCYCTACRARDAREDAARDARFWDVVRSLESRALNLPPVPTWEGEPGELRITRKATG